MGRKMLERPCTVCQTRFRPTGSRELFCSFRCALESRVDKSGGPDACWPWTGLTTAAGYGVVQVRGQNHYAHRLTLEIETGDLGDLKACHRCDNPPCCNPSHLFRGTDGDNLADAHAKGRRDNVNYATGARHGRSRKRLALNPPAGAST